jgi:hypothetical protein
MARTFFLAEYLQSSGGRPCGINKLVTAQIDVHIEGGPLNCGGYNCILV